MGIRDHPTAPRSPWPNGHVELVIGSIRRECLDHMVVFGEADLRRVQPLDRVAQNPSSPLSGRKLNRGLVGLRDAPFLPGAPF
jgi:hypothetical protein